MGEVGRQEVEGREEGEGGMMWEEVVGQKEVEEGEGEEEKQKILEEEEGGEDLPGVCSGNSRMG